MKSRISEVGSRESETACSDLGSLTSDLVLWALCAFLLLSLAGCGLSLCRHEAVKNCLVLKDRGYDVRLMFCEGYDPIWGGHTGCQARIGEKWVDFDSTFGIVHPVPLASLLQKYHARCVVYDLSDFVRRIEAKGEER